MQIAVMGSYGENGTIDINELNENLKKTDGVTVTDSITKLPATVISNGYNLRIKTNGEVIFEDEVELGKTSIYARLYEKNGSEDQILMLASGEDVFLDYGSEITLKYDMGNIYKEIFNVDDLYRMPRFGTDEWKQIEEENPDEARAKMEEALEQINSHEEMIVPWTYYIQEEFDGNSEIVEVRILNEIAPSSTKEWFEGLMNLQTIEGIEKLDTSNVTDMYCMFSYCGLNSIDLSCFDTSNVTNMQGMFQYSDFTSLNLSNFNTSKVNNMFQMFNSCRNLKNINLGNFDTSSVKLMYGMFNGCSSLESLDLRSFRTSNVTNMGIMFGDCSSLKVLDLRSFDISGLSSTAWGGARGYAYV